MKRLTGWLLAALIGGTAAADDSFEQRCARWLPQPLAPTADTGVVIIDAALRAYVPAELDIEYGRATLTGIGTGLGTHTSDYQCMRFVVIPGLAPGRYRLSALEGQISGLTVSQRFLFPMPGDGYQVVNPHDWREGPQRYRVQPPRTPALEVEVKAGAVSYLGLLDVVRSRGSIYAVTVQRRDDPTRAQAAVDRLYRLAGLAPATGASPPAAAPPAAAAP